MSVMNGKFKYKCIVYIHILDHRESRSFQGFRLLTSKIVSIRIDGNNLVFKNNVRLTNVK